MEETVERVTQVLPQLQRTLPLDVVGVDTILHSRTPSCFMPGSDQTLDAPRRMRQGCSGSDQSEQAFEW